LAIPAAKRFCPLTSAARRPHPRPKGRSAHGLNHYEILISARSIRDRKFTPLGGKERPGKEAVMLDVAFVALGVAILALMGAYALALRQL